MVLKQTLKERRGYLSNLNVNNNAIEEPKIMRLSAIPNEGRLTKNKENQENIEEDPYKIGKEARKISSSRYSKLIRT